MRSQSSVGRSRIDSILRANAIYKDDLHGRLNQELGKNKDLVIHYHRKCVSSYATISNTKWAESKARTSAPKEKSKAIAGALCLQNTMHLLLGDIVN